MVRLIDALLRLRPYAAEASVALCSLWVGKCYVSGPSNFTSYAGSYALAGDLLTEADYGALHIAAGSLTLLGLALSGGVAKTLRGAGGVLAAFVWGVLGVSFVADNPDLTVGGIALVLCATSLVALLVLPGDGP